MSKRGCLSIIFRKVDDVTRAMSKGWWVLVNVFTPPPLSANPVSAPGAYVPPFINHDNLSRHMYIRKKEHQMRRILVVIFNLCQTVFSSWANLVFVWALCGVRFMILAIWQWFADCIRHNAITKEA